MAEEIENKEPKEEQKKGGTKGVFLLVLLIAAVVGGGFMWQKYATLKKADAHLAEAKAFIESRKFDRAEETIKFAEETLPGRLETMGVKALLENEREVERLEKELVLKLKERDWDGTEDVLSSLKTVDPENERISQGSEEVRSGRLNDKREALEGELQAAIDADEIKEELRLCEELLALDPTHENAVSWKEKKEAVIKEIATRDAKAKVIYEQALTLDEGVYNGELLFLATEAKTLSSDKQYADFFTKVNSYPREIAYPAEYPTLQGAVDAARAIDTIKVAPGDYHSPVVINKTVKMIGEEGSNTIVHCVGAEGAALHVGPKGDLTTEHIMFKHSEKKQDGESAYSVVVIEGKASFTACLFYESSAHGLHVLSGGEASLLSCRAEANHWDGMAVTGKGSQLVVKGSIVSNNGHNGIDAWDGGALTFIDSFSEKNARSGASVSSVGALKIQGSTITKNNHAGLYAFKDGNADVVSSEFSKNQLAGGFGDASGTVKLVDTKVLDNRVAGIVLAKGTSWSGLETLTFDGNDDKEIWDEAEFETLDDITAIVVDEEGSEEEVKSEEEAAEGVEPDTEESSEEE